MTYEHATEIILRRLAGGDVPAEFPIKAQEVQAVLYTAAALASKKAFYESYNIEKSIDGVLMSTFITDVYTDGKERYIVLPSSPLSGVSVAMPRLQYTKDRSVEFMYVSSHNVATYMRAGVDKEVDAILYTYEHIVGCDTEHRLILLNADDCLDKIKVTMVAPASKDGDMPIGDDMAYEVMSQVVAWFSGGKSEDKTIDDKNSI